MTHSLQTADSPVVKSEEQEADHVTVETLEVFADIARSSGHDSAVTAPPDVAAANPDGSQWSKPKRTKRRVLPGERVCEVCGDRAIAHNFGAMTCETCKAFFRRNVNRAAEIAACCFANNCVINKHTRRFCAACRMKKCLEVGMDPSLQLDVHEKRAREARKQERRKPPDVVDLHVDSSTSSVQLNNPEASTSDSLPMDVAVSTEREQTLEGLSPMSAALSGCYNVVNLSPELLGPPISTASVDISSPSSTSDVSTEQSAPFSHILALGSRFRHVERNELPWDIQLYWPLTMEERNLLTQLTTAYTHIQLVLRPTDQEETFDPDQPLCVDSLMFLLDTTLRKCVRFAKTIGDFKELGQADQITSLKASALETYTFRSAALYILEKQAWRTYKGDVDLAELQDRFQDHSSTIDYFADYCFALKSVTKANSTLYALLHCITLFDVRDTKLQDRLKVNRLKDKYLVLLKHYLESEFSYLHASRYMVELMALLEDAHNLRYKVMGFYRHFSSFFRPLVAEFLTT